MSKPKIHLWIIKYFTKGADQYQIKYVLNNDIIFDNIDFCIEDAGVHYLKPGGHFNRHFERP